ncbi:MAG: hypothetical protein ACPG8Q_04020, partial [Candidatus Poseidoniaceae archaeon]
MRPVAARPLSPPPAGLVLASPSSPWRTVGRMVGLVILLYLISTPIYFIFVGLLDGDFDFQPGPANPWMTMTGALCSLPLVALVLYLRRPRLTHVILAGDEDQVPATLVTNGGGTGYCDPCYAYVEGDDHYP